MWFSIVLPLGIDNVMVHFVNNFCHINASKTGPSKLILMQLLSVVACGL